MPTSCVGGVCNRVAANQRCAAAALSSLWINVKFLAVMPLRGRQRHIEHAARIAHRCLLQLPPRVTPIYFREPTVRFGLSDEHSAILCRQISPSLSAGRRHRFRSVRWISTNCSSRSPRRHPRCRSTTRSTLVLASGGKSSATRRPTTARWSSLTCST